MLGAGPILVLASPSVLPRRNLDTMMGRVVAVDGLVGGMFRCSAEDKRARLRWS